MAQYRRRTYHSAYNEPAWRNARNLQGSYVGVELEVETRNTPYGRLLSILPDLRGKGRPLVETDGSLSYLNGVELIFPPVRPSSIKKANSALKQTMESLNGVEMSTNSRVGLHLNINCSDWTEDRKFFAVAAVVGLPASFLTGLGGRRPNNYCAIVRNPSAWYIWHECRNHHTAASLRGHRIELRFPKTTTDPERLDRLLDFINQLEKYTKQIADPFPSGDYNGPRVGWVAGDFLEYMKKNRIGKRVLAYVENQNIPS